MQLTIEKIKKRNGIAGTFAYDVDLAYQISNWALRARRPIIEKLRVTFTSSVYGAPAVMILPSGQQVIITDWTRFGEVLNPQWIKNFYAEEMAS